MFGRATITLGIGPHSSLSLYSETREEEHLLKGTPNSVVDWIQVRAVWVPHIRLEERDVLTPQERTSVRRPAARRTH